MIIRGLSVKVHDGNGPYLLLLHGMLASRSQFLLNIPDLQQHTRPISVELLGHHASESPEDPSLYGPSAYVETFETIREELGIDRWLVGGCSLGASLTMNYALSYPNRVMGQFFTNSTSAFADAEMQQIWRKNSENSYHRMLQAGKKGLERIPVHPRHARRLPEQVRTALIEDSQDHDVKGMALTSRYTSPFGSIRQRVGEFKMPSLLVCGRYEKRFKGHREFAETNMPGLTICDLDAGHGVNMERASEFNTAVTQLVQSVTE